MTSTSPQETSHISNRTTSNSATANSATANSATANSAMTNSVTTNRDIEERPFSSFRASQEPDVVWVSVSPSLSVFDRPLLKGLAKQTTVAQWQYAQEADESCSIGRVLAMLEHYLKQRHQPVHLIGHGMSGAIALLYTRLHPERVKSLTLLAVAEQPAVTWHASYYVQRHLMPCTQACILTKMVRQLFTVSLPYPTRYLLQALSKDLEQAPLLHSLCQIESLPQGGIEVPLLVCGASDDMVAHPAALQDWHEWFRSGDRLWTCEQGGHFFHYFQPLQVAHQVSNFWQSLSPATAISANRCSEVA